MDRGARFTGVPDGPWCPMNRGARWTVVSDGPWRPVDRGARWITVCVAQSKWQLYYQYLHARRLDIGMLSWAQYLPQFASGVHFPVLTVDT